MTEQTRTDGWTRWWEFYAIRYAMGTVVGAILFYFLCQSSLALQPLPFQTLPVGSATEKPVVGPQLDATRLTLLAAYGLVYCYIASAPVLVFHAGRFLLELGTGPRTKLKWLALCILPPILVAVVAYALPSSRPLAERLLFSGSSFALAAILLLQIVVVCRTLSRNAELYAFYARLAARRGQATGEITESYRHLREHGNSFFIVFLEAVLALILFGATTLTPVSVGTMRVTADAVLPVILVAWIVPSALVRSSPTRWT